MVHGVGNGGAKHHTPPATLAESRAGGRSGGARRRGPRVRAAAGSRHDLTTAALVMIAGRLEGDAVTRSPPKGTGATCTLPPGSKLSAASLSGRRGPDWRPQP